MKRVYHPYHLWEDYLAGMWRKVDSSEEKIFLEKAIAFTGDHLLYGSWMMKVIEQWPITCEHNLTDPTQNRRAWIGHCAAALGINCPEYITRLAWGFLNQGQQDRANADADKAIEAWELKNCGSDGVEYGQALFIF